VVPAPDGVGELALMDSRACVTSDTWMATAGSAARASMETENIKRRRNTKILNLRIK